MNWLTIEGQVNRRFSELNCWHQSVIKLNFILAVFKEKLSLKALARMRFKINSWWCDNGRVVDRWVVNWGIHNWWVVDWWVWIRVWGNWWVDRLWIANYWFPSQTYRFDKCPVTVGCSDCAELNFLILAISLNININSLCMNLIIAWVQGFNLLAIEVNFEFWVIKISAFSCTPFKFKLIWTCL